MALAMGVCQQSVSGFKIGKSYTVGITVSNYVDGTLRMQIDSGSLLNVNIGGAGTYTSSFTATAYTHQFRIWGQAYTVLNAQVNFSNPSIKITNSGDIISVGDTQSLNPASLNIGNGHPGEYTQSDISEILVYNGTLTNKDHNNIYTYLKSKWLL